MLKLPNVQVILTSDNSFHSKAEGLQTTKKVIKANGIATATEPNLPQDLICIMK